MLNRRHTAPRWLPAPLFARLQTAHHNRSWLLETESLTQRLRQDGGHITIRILSEKWARPMNWEAQCLKLPQHQRAWIRTIEMQRNGQPVIYARTVIPDCHPGNPWYPLKALGNRPLGEILFQLPGLKRSGFDLSRTATSDWPELNHAASTLLARRSIFIQGRAPLLLTEVFLTLAP